ncbi:MAG: hypothetical protein WC220_08185 [Pedobacter sp.]|jgi:hypothetical protein
MKVLLSFILFILIAAEIKAQAASASLYITFSDIQSVRIVELPAQAKGAVSEIRSDKKNISILNPAAYQIRKFDSQTGNTEVLLREINTGIEREIPELVYAGNSKKNQQIAGLSKQTKSAVPLVVYQIDPR